jgi:hypothetical protein
LWSDRIGLIGKADLVEFHPDGSVFPVEFKHGPKRKHTHDDIQLAAQAMCLEEMLGKPVMQGSHLPRQQPQAARCGPSMLPCENLVEETTEAVRSCIREAALPSTGERCPLRPMLPEGDLPTRSDRRCPHTTPSAQRTIRALSFSPSPWEMGPGIEGELAMHQLENTLYVMTPNAYAHLENATVRIDVEREKKLQVPLHHLAGLVTFGNVMVSPCPHAQAGR